MYSLHAEALREDGGGPGAAEGRVGGDGDAVLAAELHQRLLLHVHVQLHLQVGGPDAAHVQDLLDLPLVEVGQADSLGATRVHLGLHLLRGMRGVGWRVREARGRVFLRQVWSV